MPWDPRPAPRYACTAPAGPEASDAVRHTTPYFHDPRSKEEGYGMGRDGVGWGMCWNWERLRGFEQACVCGLSRTCMPHVTSPRPRTASICAAARASSAALAFLLASSMASWRRCCLFSPSSGMSSCTSMAPGGWDGGRAKGEPRRRDHSTANVTGRHLALATALPARVQRMPPPCTVGQTLPPCASRLTCGPPTRYVRLD